MTTQSHLNFFLCRLEATTASRLTAQLAERGIAIRNASNFVGLNDRYVRIALRARHENERLIMVLREIGG
jgi:threonine-phosphate decarboxylase